YSDQTEAIKAVLVFCQSVGLPPPGFVGSGHGVHAYWCLASSVSRDVWLRYATGLKLACKDKGLLADGAVTADPARILRCPGTYNHKSSPPSHVFAHKLFFDPACGPYDIEQFDGLLSYLPAVIGLPETPAAPTAGTVMDDNTLAYYSSMLDAIPNDDTVPYDKWFRIGAAVYELGWGDTGRTMWHDWSAKAPKHTDEEFDKAWAGFPKYRETHLDNLVTPGTLVHYAAESGWTTPSEVTPPPPPPAVFIPPPELVEAGDRYALHVEEVLFKGPELTDKLCYPKNSFRNARWALAQLGVRGRFDEFSGHKEIMYPDEDWTLRTDAVDGRARVAVMWACHGTDVGDGHVRAALDELCVVGRHNPVRDYLARLRWDGVSRLDTWLTDYCGASDTPLNRFYGSATLVAAVRRVFKDYPVPFDHMLVLEGPQGVGKSTVVQVLGRGLSPEGWYKNQEINWADPRTALEVFRGCWFYEWAELSGHNRADSRRIKSCLSSQSDEGRVAYAHNPDATIRRTILVGTVNPLEAYLDDQTGNRRYWCIRTGDDKFRLDEFRRDIDQI